MNDLQTIIQSLNAREADLAHLEADADDARNDQRAGKIAAARDDLCDLIDRLREIGE